MELIIGEFMELQYIKGLLPQVSAVHRQYEKIAGITGEHFNIFKILGLSTNEVRTHSAFIAELLNPKGSHGQNELFLDLFCNQMGIKDFECKQATVQIEKYIGLISDDYSDGGYIDILISDKSRRAIVIENKIYAGDQKNQLLRYYKYAKRNFIKHTQLYLTLDGSQDSTWNLHDNPEDYYVQNISYSANILAWLEKCKEKAVNHPLQRETITQYINLIKILTGQTKNQEMKEELVKILTVNGSSISAAIAIENVVFNAKIELLKVFSLKLKQEIEKQIPFIEVIMESNFGEENKDIHFKFRNNENIKVRFRCSTPLRNATFIVEGYDLNIIDEIDIHTNGWGRRESWGNAWVRRYGKMDNLLNESDFWAKIADNNIDDSVNDIAQDIILLITVLNLR